MDVKCKYIPVIMLLVAESGGQPPSDTASLAKHCAVCQSIDGGASARVGSEVIPIRRRRPSDRDRSRWPGGGVAVRGRSHVSGVFTVGEAERAQPARLAGELFVFQILSENPVSGLHGAAGTGRTGEPRIAARGPDAPVLGPTRPQDVTKARGPPAPCRVLLVVPVSCSVLSRPTPEAQSRDSRGRLV